MNPVRCCLFILLLGTHFTTQAESLSFPVEDSQIILDSYGENFQKVRSSILLSSRYMEQDCKPVTTWQSWSHFPLKYCRYRTLDKQAEVLMLNPGIRRLTLWLQNACKDLANDFTHCMERSFRQILSQSGAQFPIAGVVVEDMDGNRRGNSYAFRNGVTVKIDAFSSGTESTLSQQQILRSFTDTVRSTLTYARPISTTRELLTDYADFMNLNMLELGTSAERKNVFNLVVADLYKRAWFTAENHLIRSWVHSQNF